MKTISNDFKKASVDSTWENVETRLDEGRNLLIFSAQLSSEAEWVNSDNASRCKNLLEQNGVPYTICEGVYEGSAEESYIVNNRYEKVVKELCARFRQECYLKVNRKRIAILVFPDRNELLGHYKKVQHTPKGRSYTKLKNGQMFIAEF